MQAAMQIFFYRPMSRTTLLLWFAVCSAAAAARGWLRIANGGAVGAGGYNYTVSVRRNLVHACGGSILNQRYVLTAAVCVCDENGPVNVTSLTVQYGTVNVTATNDKSVAVANVTCYPFARNVQNNDVAVLQLAAALNASDNSWSTVTLADTFDTDWTNQGVVVGWGVTEPYGNMSSTLLQLDVQILADAICSLRINYLRHLCSTGGDGGLCEGDFGSPLVVGGLQVGIASYSLGARCGVTGAFMPDVFTRITYYVDWIRANSQP
ncbi:chymotrypsin-1-like [Cylas formicarius]|uniref:chymotrypsin-1-like n=1 Tax=Cylas formicarius TaxID=197179 RepID=UPI0029587FE1|nr:chymotrypsin-1-like [Cylas formicarius]